MNIQLRKFDSFFKFLIWYSVATYFVELHLGTENSHEGHRFFLWSERIVALIFTGEFFIRFRRGGLAYLKSPLGFIDLVSVLPFWVGFFVPTEWLGLVRAMRLLRLMMYFRYSRGMQLIALGFYRSLRQLQLLGFGVFIIWVVMTAVMYETERKAQSEKFATPVDAAYFSAITMATIGYGDISPVTLKGRISTMAFIVPALAVFGGMIGVLGSAFSTVLQECSEDDVDIAALFAEVRDKRRKSRQLDREFRWRKPQKSVS